MAEDEREDIDAEEQQPVLGARSLNNSELKRTNGNTSKTLQAQESTCRSGYLHWAIITVLVVMLVLERRQVSELQLALRNVSKMEDGPLDTGARDTGTLEDAGSTSTGRPGIGAPAAPPAAHAPAGRQPAVHTTSKPAQTTTATAAQGRGWPPKTVQVGSPKLMSDGCWALSPSGCPERHEVSYYRNRAPAEWKLEPGFGSTEDACYARRSELNAWCGVNDMQVRFMDGQVKNVMFWFTQHKTGSTMLTKAVLPALVHGKLGFGCQQKILCVPPDKRAGFESRHACEGDWANDKWEVLKGWRESCGGGVMGLLRNSIDHLASDDVLQRYLNGLSGGTCRLVFHIRHPWDILISMYSSFTKNHPFPDGISEQEKAQMIKRRESANAMGLDEYIKTQTDSVNAYQEWAYRTAYQLQESGTCKVFISHYEDMVVKPHEWALALETFLGLPDSKRGSLTSWADTQSTVKPSKDGAGHVVHLHPKNWKTDLKPATLEYLKSRLTATQFYQSRYFSGR